MGSRPAFECRQRSKSQFNSTKSNNEGSRRVKGTTVEVLDLRMKNRVKATTSIKKAGGVLAVSKAAANPVDRVTKIERNYNTTLELAAFNKSNCCKLV